MQEIAGMQRLFGYRRIGVLLEHKGMIMSQKKLYRLYWEEWLSVKRRRGRPTEAKTAAHRGDGPIAAGIVKLLLDGQQRMTALYGVVREHPPKFFDGNPQAFTGPRFNLGTEIFAFY